MCFEVVVGSFESWSSPLMCKSVHEVPGAEHPGLSLIAMHGSRSPARWLPVGAVVHLECVCIAEDLSSRYQIVHEGHCLRGVRRARRIPPRSALTEEFVELRELLVNQRTVRVELNQSPKPFASPQCLA